MDALEIEYRQKKNEYDTLIASPNPSVEHLKEVNIELSEILNEMLKELAKVKETAGHVESVRNDLVKKLVKIQKEYTAIIGDVDQVETLRALHSHEDAKFKAVFFWYGLSLALLSTVFFFVLLWKGGYKAPTMPTMMSSPTTTAPFM
jgi:hypothetical protein